MLTFLTVHILVDQLVAARDSFGVSTDGLYDTSATTKVEGKWQSVAGPNMGDSERYYVINLRFYCSQILFWRRDARLSART